LDGSTKYNYLNSGITIQIELDIYYLEKEQHSLKWNNLIRFKIINEGDSEIVINTINCEMIGKKTKVKGIINNTDFPLYIHGKNPVDFFVPVSFEYSRSIGANHHVIIEINDMFINGKRIDIQPVTFTYSKI
jgi:hypothetical protein